MERSGVLGSDLCWGCCPSRSSWLAEKWPVLCWSLYVTDTSVQCPLFQSSRLAGRPQHGVFLLLLLFLGGGVLGGGVFVFCFSQSATD